MRSSDQIHPDTKREKLPPGAIPAYSLFGGFPSCRISSQVLQCAAFLLFWHHFWDWETRNLLGFARKKKQNEQMCSCKSQEGVEVEYLCFSHFHVPPAQCHLGSATHSSAKAGGAKGTGSAMGTDRAMERQPWAQQCRRVAVLLSQWQGHCWLLLMYNFCQGTVWLRDSTETGWAGKAGFLQQQQQQQQSGAVGTRLPTVYHTALNQNSVREIVIDTKSQQKICKHM